MSSPNTLLCCLIPALYFGLQAGFAPFFPGYSIWTTTASDLGAETSPFGQVFSACILILGAVMTLAALTLPIRLRDLGLPWGRAALPAAAVLSGALITFAAGLYPQPHPNHSGGALGAGFIALPLVFPLALWPVAGRALRAYLLINLAAFGGAALVMSGIVPVAGAMEGAVQKLFGLTVFVPPAVTALALTGARR